MNTTIIILCDDPFCSNEAIKRAHVTTKRGRVVKACNCCPLHLASVRAVASANPDGKYKLVETEPS